MNWIAGILSGVVAYRLWKRRQKPAPATAPATETAPVPEQSDDRAEELRAKLAETRGSEEPAPAQPTEPAEPTEQPAEPLEERRRRVHEEGRSAIDRMNDT